MFVKHDTRALPSNRAAQSRGSKNVFVTIPGVAQVAIQYRGPNANVMYNVFHVRGEAISPIDPGDLEILMDELVQWVTATLDTRMGNTTLVQSIRVRSMETEVAPFLEYFFDPPNAGTIASPAMPSNVTLAVKLNTGMTGRSARGLVYFVGLTESMVSGDYVVAPFAGNIVAAWETLRVNLISEGTWRLCVASTVKDGAPRPIGIYADVQSVSITDARVDTQRRRLPKLST